ncbi:MAG: TaqI-like C-terminal specificity domain-containing protein [Candidatus Pacearchaeota archaeon]
MSGENTLFNDTTIKRLVSDTKLTSKQKKASQEWLKLIEEDKLIKEKQGYLRFYDIILKELLGYDNIKHEKEGVEFSYEKEGKPILRIEAKGMDTPDLFLPQKRAREESPVQQLWRYMQLHASPYGIVTNYKIFIFFKYDIGSTKYYLFDFEEIKKDSNKLQEFVAIFSKENIDKGFVEDLYEESIIEEREFTKEFYKLYHETRLMLIKEFEENPDISREASVHFAQLFLNRLMFVFFAEDTGKIDKRVIEDRILKTLDNIHLFSSNSSNISNVLVGLFRDLDKGSDFPIKVFGFNGGLFHHPIPPKIYFKDFRDSKFFKDVNQYSKLKKKDLEINEKEKEIFEKYKNKISPIIKNVLLMASFDFNTEVDVNILGHIFEQSISDIEDLKIDKSSRRKKEGIYYTPSYITDYICRNTIIPYLSNKGETEISGLIKEYADNIWDLEKKFKEMKILDPACGSGAFLIRATDIMLEVFKAIQEFKQQEGEYGAKRGLKRKSNNKGQLILEKWNEEAEAREIIENNIYGVDINEESVEITKLSLFLKMARKNRKLTDLSNNIKKGNSLINDSSVAGDLAFDWDKEFKDIMDNGGFDVVIGNPPYVEARSIEQKFVDFLRKNYKTSGNRINIFASFIEKGLSLLKTEGYFSYIIHRNLIRSNDYHKTRRYILDNSKIKQILSFSQGVFEGVTGEMTVVILKKSNYEKKENTLLVYEYGSEINPDIKPWKIKQGIFEETAGNRFNIYLTDKKIKILEKIKQKCSKLGELAETYQGIIVGNEKKYVSKNKESDKYKPILRGRDISRYGYPRAKEFVYYVPGTKVLTRGKTPSLFEKKEKILTQHVSGDIIATLDAEQKYFLQTINSTTSIKEGIKNKYLLTLLNSKVINFYYSSIFNLGAEFTTAVAIENLDELPIKTISLSEQKPFIEKSDLMLKLNKEFYEKKNKFLKLIKHEYKIEKITKKLDEFYKLEFDDFIKQLKIKVNIDKKSEILDFFEKNKKEISKLKEEIDKTDREIDEMVYGLYGLTKEEIGVVEGSLN